LEVMEGVEFLLVFRRADFFCLFWRASDEKTVPGVMERTSSRRVFHKPWIYGSNLF